MQILIVVPTLDLVAHGRKLKTSYGFLFQSQHFEIGNLELDHSIAIVIMNESKSLMIDML
jgi:hypothetical protein